MNPSSPDEPSTAAVETEWAEPEPGEHWKSDLLTWGLPVFGEPVDGHLREAFGLAGDEALDGEPWLPLLTVLAPGHDRQQGTAAQRALLASKVSGHLSALRLAANPPPPTQPHWRRRLRAYL